MPGVEPAVNAIDLIKPLLQQLLRGALAQMKRARSMTHRIALRIADIDQYRRLLMQFLVRFFNIDAFKLFHDSLLFLVMTGDGRPNFTL